MAKKAVVKSTSHDKQHKKMMGKNPMMGEKAMPMMNQKGMKAMMAKEMKTTSKPKTSKKKK